VTNNDSQETSSPKEVNTNTGNEERKFPHSNLLCQLTEKKKKEKTDPFRQQRINEIFSKYFQGYSRI